MYHVSRKIYSVIKSRLDDEDWFGENSGDTKLATLDALFLFFYAVGLYFGGSIGDRYNPRYVLSIGMTAVSFCVIIFGLCGIANVRSLWVYATIWSVNGLLQSSGWPTNVGIMGSWFKFEDRGMKMGLWAGNASFGNIVGTGVAAILLYEMVRKILCCVVCIRSLYPINQTKPQKHTTTTTTTERQRGMAMEYDCCRNNGSCDSIVVVLLSRSFT